MTLRVEIRCPVCGAKRKMKVPYMDLLEWLDARPEPVRCTSCGEDERIEIVTEAQGK